jgi:hypothetical protein
MIDMKVQSGNAEVEKWKKKVAEERKSFDFVQIDFLVDMREAERRYKEDRKNDVNRTDTLQLTFLQWLDIKKYEALQFEKNHNEHNLD